jgi:hypothetical protein
MDNHEVKVAVLEEFAAIKASLLESWSRVNALEQSFLAPEIPASESTEPLRTDITWNFAPLVFEGCFEPNLEGKESPILEFTNDSNETIHFDSTIAYELGAEPLRPYIFGRLKDTTGKKLEGQFKVYAVNSDNRAVLVSATTELLNFSHPTKPNDALYLDNHDSPPLLPGGKLIFTLESKQHLDTAESKIVFESLTFVGVNTQEGEY